MSVRGPRTKHGKALVAVYALSVSFSLAALLLTVVALNVWPFLREEVPSTSNLFSNFGLVGGALLQVGAILVSILAFPIVILCFLRLGSRYAEGTSLGFNMANVVGWSLIEAWAVSSLLSSFLNFLHDFLLIHFVLEDDLFTASLFSGAYEFIKTFNFQILFIAFFAILAIRLCLYFRKEEQASKALR